VPRMVRRNSCLNIKSVLCIHTHYLSVMVCASCCNL
jgi:hypothetical protein